MGSFLKYNNKNKDQIESVRLQLDIFSNYNYSIIEENRAKNAMNKY